MAKGWESKSVEEQQSLASQSPISEADRSRLSQEHKEKVRTQHALQLNRVRVQQQMEKCSNDRYRQMLQQELNFLDAEIKKFN
jgi:hypothetical protein